MGRHGVFVGFITNTESWDEISTAYTDHLLLGDVESDTLANGTTIVSRIKGFAFGFGPDNSGAFIIRKLHKGYSTEP
jgi:hypothetical protein